MTRALLLDPRTREITVVEHSRAEAINEIHDLVGTSNLDHAVLMQAAMRALCMFVDGEGYYQPDQVWARLTFYPNPIAGRAFLYIADEAGETIDLDSWFENLIRSSVIWLAKEPPLPPIVVNGEIAVSFDGPDRPKTVQETMERLGLTPKNNPTQTDQ
jgi:hypothetical protein